MAKTKTGAELLVDCLRAHHVKYVFGVPGASIMPILEAMRKKGPKFIICRHEQNAAFMAQAWGRLTGTPGVCIATVGPGATNLVTGVATANADRDPVIAIAGQTPRAEQWMTRHQNIDEEGLFKPITKWSAQINEASAIGEAFAQAYRTSLEPRQGAVFLAFPQDVLKSETAAKPVLRPLDQYVGEANPDAIRAALKHINKAKRPIALIGVGATDAASTKSVRAFLARTGIPAVSTFEAAGVVGRELIQQYLGRVGLSIEEPGDIGIKDADLVLTIGYDVIEYAPPMWAKEKRVIHIDRQPSEVDVDYQPLVEVIGNIADSLKAIQDGIRKQWTMTKREQRAREEIVAEQERGSEIGGFKIHPARLVHELRRVLDDDDLMISDVGSHQLWLAREFFTFQPRTLLFSMGFQTMGIALPWAIAARLADKKRRIVSCSGDGSFLMSATELETAVRLRLPLVHIVWRDGSYNLVAIQQQAAYGKTYGVDFGNPDIVWFARSFGAYAYRVKRPKDIAPTLRRALRHNGPVVIDVPVNYRYNLGLLGKGSLFGGRKVD